MAKANDSSGETKRAKQITVRVSPELHRSIRILAATAEATIDGLVRGWLEEMIAAQGQKPRPQGQSPSG